MKYRHLIFTVIITTVLFAGCKMDPDVAPMPIYEGEANTTIAELLAMHEIGSSDSYVHISEDIDDIISTGIVTTSDEHGNCYKYINIEDETGELYVFGTFDAQGEKGNFASLGIEVGNEVTVEGVKATDNGVSMLVDAKVIEIRKPSVTIASVSPANAVVPKEGGDVAVTMVNFVPGITVNTHVPLLASSWVKYEYAVSGEQLTITFHIAANAGDERSANIKLICSGEKAYSLVAITQESGVGTGIAAFGLNDKEEMINDKWYNLKGQRLSTPPAKGLYLRQGKKVVY